MPSLRERNISNSLSGDAMDLYMNPERIWQNQYFTIRDGDIPRDMYERQAIENRRVRLA